MTSAQVRVPNATTPPTRDLARTRVMLGASVFVALSILLATAFALVTRDPYRSLPDATVLAARGQDVVSVLVAGLLVALVRSAHVSPFRLLVWIGLLAYVVYSYAIYLIGVPMNRIFLLYVVLEMVVVLPAVGAVGVLLLRRHRLGGPLAVIALVKILTLFGALWAGPVYALVTHGPVDLGPDAGPSLLLLVASAWLLRRWRSALAPTGCANDRAGS